MARPSLLIWVFCGHREVTPSSREVVGNRTESERVGIIRASKELIRDRP